MKVILIAGKAEAGKTATANIIKDYLEESGVKVAIIPYGDYVKHTAKLLFGWDGKKDEAGRHLLQWWGTDVVREKNPAFWVATVWRLVNVAQDELDYVIIDDCRFPDEITWWTEDCTEQFLNVHTIRVERPGWENALTPEQRQHPSETSLDDWSFNITISATDIQQLKKEVYSKVLPQIVK